MDLSKFESIDPHLLIGLVNTELRNNSDDLEDLCKTHDIDETALIELLAEFDYVYNTETKQFR